MQNKKSFWPYGIILSIISIAAACIATVIISLDYPVYVDKFYFQKYQDVDKQYDVIHKQQKEFEKKYEVKLVKDLFNTPNLNLEVEISSKDGSLLGNFKYISLITRPETSEFDFTPKIEQINKDNSIILRFSDFKASKKGRWQVLIKLNDGQLTGFYKLEIVIK